MEGNNQQVALLHTVWPAPSQRNVKRMRLVPTSKVPYECCMRQCLNHIVLVMAVAALMLLPANFGMSSFAKAHTAVVSASIDHHRAMTSAEIHHHLPDASEHCANGDRTSKPHQCNGALCPAGLCVAQMGLVPVQDFAAPELGQHQAMERDQHVTRPTAPPKRPPRA